MQAVNHRGEKTVSLRPILRILMALAMIAPLSAHAAYPDRPIYLIVPFPPGGGADTSGRLLAQRLSEVLGQTVIVANHPGAGSNIGNAFAAHAAPDGYTLLYASPSAAINASLYRSLPYDLLHDLTPVAGVVSNELVLIVPAHSKARSVAELVAQARAQPGKLAYASAGIGSTEHLAGEMFRQLAGIDVLHVPYKGTGPAVNDLMAGRVQFLFGGSAAMLPLAQGGQVRALAVTSAHRLPDLPDIPTVQEGGVAGYEVTLWNGVLAPTGTPPEVVRFLNQAISTAATDLAPRFHPLGGHPLILSPDELGALIAAQIAKWHTIIEQADVHAD